MRRSQILTQIITWEDHGCSLGNKKGKHEILHLSFPQAIYIPIVCLTLHPTIPGEIIIRAIPVILPICSIPLLIVRYQITESESIMGYHKVYAMIWLPTSTTWTLTHVWSGMWRQLKWPNSWPRLPLKEQNVIMICGIENLNVLLKV